jgi:hypothetical protein
MASWPGNIHPSKKAKPPHSQFPIHREKPALTKKQVLKKAEKKNSTLQPLATLRLRGIGTRVTAHSRVDPAIRWGY